MAKLSPDFVLANLLDTFCIFLSFQPACLSLSLSLFLLVWAEISISRVENCGKKTTVLLYITI